MTDDNVIIADFSKPPVPVATTGTEKLAEEVAASMQQASKQAEVTPEMIQAQYARAEKQAVIDVASHLVGYLVAEACTLAHGKPLTDARIDTVLEDTFRVANAFIQKCKS